MYGLIGVPNVVSDTQCVIVVSFNVIIYEHWVVLLLEIQLLCCKKT